MVVVDDERARRYAPRGVDRPIEVVDPAALRGREYRGDF